MHATKRLVLVLATLLLACGTAPGLASAATRIREAGDLNLLVNNAGFGTLGYFFDADPHTQDQMHRLHVLATMRLSQAALANLVPRAAEGTGVINVSSVAAYVVSPQGVSYNSTKTWMNRFTEALAFELRTIPSSVTVQALCPGFTLTEFHDVVRLDRQRRRPPAGRDGPRPADERRGHADLARALGERPRRRRAHL